VNTVIGRPSSSCLPAKIKCCWSEHCNGVRSDAEPNGKDMLTLPCPGSLTLSIVSEDSTSSGVDGLNKGLHGVRVKVVPIRVKQTGDWSPASCVSGLSPLENEGQLAGDN
jgi:hypothetical protein